MDLFFALRGGQIGRSVMWSNGAILPILGIICILSIAGAILIYSYSAAFEAFRKSLREKTARYLAIFLVLMELCGMTYVDLYHTHLLGGLGKTASRWGRRGSHVSPAAQKISRLPLDSPAYKVFQDIKNYNPSYDSPYTLKANIEEVLEDKNLDPDIRLELEKVHNWSLGEVQKCEVRWQAVRAQEDAQWEKIKNTTDPEATNMAENRLLRQGRELSQEQLEDCCRTLLLAGGNSKFAVTQETMDYVRGVVGDRLSPEDYARIENEARAILSTSQGAAPANPAGGAPVSQNPSPATAPQTAPASPTDTNLLPNNQPASPPVQPDNSGGPSQYLPPQQLNGGISLSPPPTGIPSRQAQAFVPGVGPVVPKTAPPPPSPPPAPRDNFTLNTAGNVLSFGSYPTLLPLQAARKYGVPGLAWVPKASTKGSQFTDRDWLVHAGGATAAGQAGAFDTLGPNLGNTGASVWNFITDPSYYNAGQVIGNVGEAYELCYTEDLS